MRILFTFAGGAGHFIPLLPIARAAQAAGHSIVFGGQPSLHRRIEQAGFAALDTGGPTLHDESRRLPLLPLDMAREYRVVRETYAGRLARARAAAIIARAEEGRPDLLICDEMDFGALIAAEYLSLPRARLLVIASGALTPHPLIAEKLNALRADYGLAPDPDLAMLSRPLVLSPFPPRLRDPGFPLPATAQHFRPFPPPPRAHGPAAEPMVYVTLGTVFNIESGDLFRRILAGLAALPVQIVVTVGSQIDPAELGPQPPCIRIERFLDQAEILPHCDLVLSHAGSGTLIGALAHGLPLVLLPIGADQPLNADRCRALGLARVLDPVTATPGQIAEAAAAVLNQPSWRQAAQCFRDEIAALPEPSEIVPMLERLAARRDGDRRTLGPAPC